MMVHDLFKATFGLLPEDDENRDALLVKVARHAVRNGFAIVPVTPRDKIPLCTLTARQAKQADAEATLTAGGRKKRHSCGWTHAMTDVAEAGRVFARMVKARPGLNLGIETGASEMVLIDADQLHEVEAFVKEWAAETGDQTVLAKKPTVTSPGVMNVGENGEEVWKHKGGGHFWFTVPDGVNLVALPGRGMLKADTGWVAYWHSHQALVPPSVRPEGPYTITGEVEPLPGFLLDRIMLHAESWQERATKQKARALSTGDPIDVWSAETPWSDILAEEGWEDTGVPENGCGCPIWTRPGDPAHARSAVAHEVGCSEFDTSTGWGPIHLWTDDGPEWLVEARNRTGRDTFSKLSWVAWRDHSGNNSAAMEALGIEPRREASDAERGLTDLLEEMIIEDPSEASGSGTEPEADPAEETVLRGGRVDLRGYLAGTLPTPPEPTVLARTDGFPMFYPATINGLFGEPESGKSWVALAGCAEVLDRGGRAAYCDVDSNGVPALLTRLQALGCAWEQAITEDRFMIFEPQDKDEFKEMMIDVSKAEMEFFVVDSVGEAMVMNSLSTESNDEITVFFRYLGLLCPNGTCVLTLDHVVKNKEARGGYAIGGQAKKRRINGSYFETTIEQVYAPGKGGKTLLVVQKDRHGQVRAHASGEGTAQPFGVFHLQAAGGYEIIPADSTTVVAGTDESRKEALYRAITDAFKIEFDNAKKAGNESGGWAAKSSLSFGKNHKAALAAVPVLASLGYLEQRDVGTD